jgi:hypothetical protein
MRCVVGKCRCRRHDALWECRCRRRLQCWPHCRRGGGQCPPCDEEDLGDDTIGDWGSGDGVLRNTRSSSRVLRWRGERRSARSDRVGGGVLAKDAFGCCRLSLGAPKAYTVDQRQMWFCLSKMRCLIGVSVGSFQLVPQPTSHSKFMRQKLSFQLQQYP